MIGDHYHTERWNCTHEVAQWYSLNGYGDVIKPVVSSSWDTEFVLWMRRRFDIVETVQQGDLVVMRDVLGLHVGVWDNGMVHHCSALCQQTVRSPLIIINKFFKEVFYARLKQHD